MNFRRRDSLEELSLRSRPWLIDILFELNPNDISEHKWNMERRFTAATQHLLLPVAKIYSEMRNLLEAKAHIRNRRKSNKVKDMNCAIHTLNKNRIV